MGGSGDGARSLADVFPKNHVKVVYAEHFLMPNNVNNLFFLPLAGKKLTRWYLRKTNAKMQTACDNINSGVVKRRGFNPVSRALGLIQGAFMPGIERRGTRKVWIDSDCDRCGLCASICPMKNFGLENGRVIMRNDCMICYRCVNKCPRRAIAVFVRAKVRKQYGGFENEKN